MWGYPGRWPAAAFCLAGAVHRASALPLCVAGAVHRAFWRSCGAVAAAGPRLPFAWQPAIHRHRAWRGRRNTQSSTLITNPHSSTSDRSTSHHNSSQLITSQLITVPLLTPHFSQLPYHIATSHHTLSQLIPSTAPLLTPLLTPHLSHQNSSQLHFSHLTSQVHFSHLTSHTSPKFTLKSYIHKGLTCGVIRSFYYNYYYWYNPIIIGIIIPILNQKPGGIQPELQKSTKPRWRCHPAIRIDSRALFRPLESPRFPKMVMPQISQNSTILVLKPMVAWVNKLIVEIATPSMPRRILKKLY